MTCREVSDVMFDYVSGELSARVREVFERRLDVCNNCREYLALCLKAVAFGRRVFGGCCAWAVSRGYTADIDPEGPAHRQRQAVPELLEARATDVGRGYPRQHHEGPGNWPGVLNT